jgi:uncharacterized protein
MRIEDMLTEEFKLNQTHVQNIIKLIDEGNTIPFIARYRKELTGSCDDQVLRELADRLAYLRSLEKRKEEVAESITSQEKMTAEIQEMLDNARTLAEVEDIYLPYRPKRRTRASIARERGLEPLAGLFFLQEEREGDILGFAGKYVDGEKGVASAEDAIAGARDIIAEWISDTAEFRKELRETMWRQADVTVRAADPEKDSVYSAYYEFSEPVRKIAPHRVLAINRGEKEGFLKASVVLTGAVGEGMVVNRFTKPGSIFTGTVREAALDSLGRLILPSMEREVRSELTAAAEEQAIKMFGLNLKPLLMQKPLKGKTILGLDPAYRTGCKYAVIDETGKVYDTGVVYPTPPQSKVAEAKAVLTRIISKYGVNVISIGNGTASKETEIFAAELISSIPDREISYAVVNEAGASVYSASALGAKEFPDFDVSLRSAVSIARRLQDPLAELVKIDPKSVGVGQYQHDMPPARLDQTLTAVVEDCVNSVGVDLNTASSSLLKYVSGISGAAAESIVTYREANGGFTSRRQLLKVPKLGPKSFEQAAGFLRIVDGGGKKPGVRALFENTGVHPESYDAAEKLLGHFSLTIKDAENGAFAALGGLVTKGNEAAVAEEIGVGAPTLRDIVAELVKPGRDIRDSLPEPVLRSDLLDIKDLKPGMELDGTVRNVVDFGVFVDIGVHQDGLVHISRMSSRYLRHPSEIAKVGDQVKVYVLEVDPRKKRISLSMLKDGQ